MANMIAGAQGVQNSEQVQPTQSTPKIAKPSSQTKQANKNRSALQDSVTISSEGRNAQIVARTNNGGGKK
jgi:uncharacterized Zn finger protein (UPF0148 family)